MRALRIAIQLVLAAVGVAHAQGPPPTSASPPPPIDDWDAQVSDFDKLRTPDSPAFVVLGVSPTEIQRPTTPRTLIAALGGALSNSSLTVPKDFALEIAPYWLFSHPDLPIQDYRSEHLMRPLRTLSLSVATTQTTRSDDVAAAAMTLHTDSHIGLGVRTTLVQLGDDDPCTARAKDKGLEIASTATLSVDEAAQLARLGRPGDKAYDATFDAMVKARVAAYDDAQKKAIETAAKVHTDKCVALATSPTGFQVDLAGALDLGVADTKLTMRATTLAGYAVWANASYDWPRLSLATMARLASHDADMTDARAFDWGARGIYKAKTYVVSAEALVRYRLTDIPDRTTMKIDGGIEYELTPDTWISVTFGKDFAFHPGDAASLFSLANLKWGFSKPPIGQ